MSVIVTKTKKFVLVTNQVQEQHNSSVSSQYRQHTLSLEDEEDDMDTEENLRLKKSVKSLLVVSDEELDDEENEVEDEENAVATAAEVDRKHEVSNWLNNHTLETLPATVKDSINDFVS